MVQLLRKAEAAARLGISVRQLEIFINAGRIPVRRLGKKCVRVDERDLDRFTKTVAV